MKSFNELYFDEDYSSDFNELLRDVTQLLNDGVDPSENQNYVIRWASRCGNAEVVKLLLEDKRVDPSDDNDTAIIWASRDGHIDVVKLLLDAKDSDGSPRVDASTNKNIAIKMAKTSGHNKVVDILKLTPSIIFKSFELDQDFHAEEDIQKLVKYKLSSLDTLSEKNQFIENKNIKKLMDIISNMKCCYADHETKDLHD